MTILEQVESSLSDFRPHNQRGYIALQIARRFNDLPNLARYLLVANSSIRSVRCSRRPRRPEPATNSIALRFRSCTSRF
jgi:hypothetical protein